MPPSSTPPHPGPKSPSSFSHDDEAAGLFQVTEASRVLLGGGHSSPTSASELPGDGSRGACVPSHSRDLSIGSVSMTPSLRNAGGGKKARSGRPSSSSSLKNAYAVRKMLGAPLLETNKASRVRGEGLLLSKRCLGGQLG